MAAPNFGVGGGGEDANCKKAGFLQSLVRGLKGREGKGSGLADLWRRTPSQNGEEGKGGI